MSKNYTKPNTPNHEDRPKDWLNSSLVFARTLGFLLDEGVGIVINAVGDMDLGVERVIVYNMGDQIHIDEFENTEIKEGSFIMIVEDKTN